MADFVGQRGSLGKLDPFSQRRIRRNIGATRRAGHFTLIESRLGFSVPESYVVDREIMLLQNFDLKTVALELAGSSGNDAASVAPALLAQKVRQAALLQSAMIQARLEEMGDFHSGLSGRGAAQWLSQRGFDCVSPAQAWGGGWQIWAHASAGVALAAPVWGERFPFSAAKLYFQWTPARMAMTSSQATQFQGSLRAVTGGYRGGVYDPKRPALTPSELTALALGGAADALRGQWVWTVETTVRLGIDHIVRAFERLAGGAFVTPWGAGEASYAQALSLLLVGHKRADRSLDEEAGARIAQARLAETPRWFQNEIAPALETRRKIEREKNKPKLRLVRAGPG